MSSPGKIFESSAFSKKKKKKKFLSFLMSFKASVAY